MKRILYPTDFSNDSIRSINQIPSVVQSDEIHYIFLHTYRLTDTMGNKNLTDYKKTRDSEISAQYELLKEQLSVYSSVTHQFISEVGFLSARLIHHSALQHIDMLIMCRSMQHELEQSKEVDFCDFISKLGRPIILLP